MKVMVVGGGGREHTIVKKIKENKDVTELYALPGNGGITWPRVCRERRTLQGQGPGLRPHLCALHRTGHAGRGAL